MYSHVRKKEKMQNIQKLDTNNVLAMARVIDKTDYFDQDYQRLIESLPGRNVPKELKELSDFSTPVVALTADAVAGSEEKYIKEGFISYLSKPFTRDQIQKEVKQILERK